MKKLNNFYQIDAFTDKPFNGNSAAVVFSDELNEFEMQKIAKEMNLSETAFLSSSKEADFNLKWFTPKVEVQLCGHATVASIHYLRETKRIKSGDEVSFKTLSGILKCKSENGLNTMHLPVPSVEEFKGDKNSVCNTLSLDENSLRTDLPFIITNNENLYICVKSINVLKNIEPDYKEIFRHVESKKEFLVITVFTTETIESGNSAHLRFFAPNYGIDEDPVTGSANGPLLLVMRKMGLIEENTEEKIFTFEQGDFLGRKGRIKVGYSPKLNDLFISGNAVTVFKGELTF